jgi:light-regulated signal transduction histidine kinase (bacteriophytochrome)
MLGQIEQRDRDLQAAKDELERRVAKRTEELTAANRELEAFSYSVAHDLRGPLDVIGNIAFLLQQEAGSPTADENLRTLTAELLRGTERMAALIDDLLNLSRATRAPMPAVPVDLSKMATAIANTLQASDPERKVSFRIAPGAKVMGDENLLRVVLDNLLRNAWKYTSKRAEAKIEFGFFPDVEGCVYYVRDNGAGFDAKFADRLFQPFQRLHTQNEFPGTGIGLATVRRIVVRHGGRVWAEGKVDEGATVYFTLDPDHANGSLGAGASCEPVM